MDLVVGRVVKAHGITGEVVVDVRTDDPEARFAPGNSLRAKPRRGGAERRLVVNGCRPHGGRLLLRLSGVVSRDDAEALRGMLFLIEATELPPIEDPDEFYDHQLEGLTVRTVDGIVVGIVAEVLHTAAGELLAVKRDGASEALVPFVEAIVTSVAVDDGVVEIDPPDGLLELE